MVTTLSNLLGEGVYNSQVVAGFEIVLEVITKKLYPVIHFLNKHTLTQCESLIDLICYDSIKGTQRFCLVYNLLSVKFNYRIRLACKMSELTNVLSVMGLFKNANWLEREVFDFFGLFFFGNKDLRRILTDYGFKGFPLRKDFPLTGYMDVYYDDNQKRICYRNLELSQEYRNFDFTTK
jgi:NADH:ubiquinone oxidoreductase subunit C